MKTVKLLNRLLFPKRTHFEDSHKENLKKAFDSVMIRQKENSGRLPLSEMKERLKRTREGSVGEESLLKEALENLRKNNFKVQIVRSYDEAFKALLEEIGPETTIVKSKSNISKEMCLSSRLSALGKEVVETDIGDRILQLSKGRPSHPTGPASHLNRADISRIVSEYLCREVPPEPEVLINCLKDDIKDAISRSTVGITGANAICAREGSVVIIHNEGNISEISRLKKHIILADTSKIYPDIEEALNMVKLQTYAATGALTTSYMNIISGLSKTADIEKKLFYGVHGPSEIILILLERPKAPEGLEASQYCIGCGGCLLECPAYQEMSSAFGAHYKQGGIGVVESAVTGSIEKAYANGLYLCMKCGLCTERCPVSIDTPSMIGSLREMAVSSGVLDRELKPYKFVANSVTSVANARRTVKDIFTSKKKGLAFFPGCISTINTPGLRSDITKILSIINNGPVRVIEGCCGGAWESFGYRDRYEDMFNGFLRSVSTGPMEIVVSCPHCYDIIWLRNGDRLKELGIEVTRFTKILERVEFEKDPEGKKVAYHDSCIFGRGLRLYDEPRGLLRQAGAEIVEMDRTRERSLCCGFPIMISDPGSAANIAQEAANAAIKAGADTLITSGCPGCYYAMKATRGIEVRDISAYLYPKLKKREAR